MSGDHSNRIVRFKLDIFKFAHRKATTLHELTIDAIEAQEI